MRRTTEANISRALVQTLRANNSGFVAATLNGKLNGVHEGIAPKGAEYPFLTYDLVYAPNDDDWSNRTIRAGFYVSAWSENQVEASNLDALISDALEDRLEPVEGQTILYCRRIAGMRFPEVDAEGKRIYRVGATYQIWTDQPLGATQETHFMADAVLA